MTTNVIIKNLAFHPAKDSIHPQTCWADVAIPYDPNAPEVQEFVPEDGGEPMIALRGKHQGKASTFYHVAGKWPSATKIGTLRPPSKDVPLPAFCVSDWVADDVAALIPQMKQLFSDGTLETSELKKIELIETSFARQVFRLLFSFSNGFWVTAFVTVYTSQDIVHLKLNHRWSNQKDPSWETHFEGLMVVTGEYFAIDFNKRFGGSDPVHADGKWHTFLSGARFMGDAQALPIYGRLLCLPSKAIPLSSPALLERIETLTNAAIGPVIGMAEPYEWEGKFLSYGHLPMIPRGVNVRTDSENFEIYMRDFFTWPGDVYEPRPYGLAPTASQTGGQEDFGAVKGSMAIVAGNPFWIHQAAWSVSEYLRGFMHMEGDGTILRQANHPNWLTWSTLTNERASADMLGKSRERPYSYGSRYTGLDNQHRSQLLTAAYLALSGDPMCEEMLIQLVETDLARDQSHVDAARASGRLLQTWANLSLVLPQDASEKCVKMMMAYLKAYKEQSLWTGPVKVSETVQDPRVGIVDELGNALPAWTVWGHAIACKGFWAAWMATKHQDFKDIALDLARSITMFGTFQTFPGTWHCCTAVRWLDGGAPLPATSYTLEPIGNARDIAIGDGGWWVWILPAILIEAAYDPKDGPEKARAFSILRQVIGDGPNTWNESEWFAVVDLKSLLA